MDAPEGLKEILVPRDLSAAAKPKKVLIRKDVVTGESIFGRVAKGTRITKQVQIAGKGMSRKIDEAKKLTNSNEDERGVHVNPGEWKKIRGNALVEMPDGETHSCEIHYYWSSQTKDVRHKIAKDYDDELWRFQ